MKIIIPYENIAFKVARMVMAPTAILCPAGRIRYDADEDRLIRSLRLGWREVSCRVDPRKTVITTRRRRKDLVRSSSRCHSGGRTEAAPTRLESLQHVVQYRAWSSPSARSECLPRKIRNGGPKGAEGISTPYSPRGELTYRTASSVRIRMHDSHDFVYI